MRCRCKRNIKDVFNICATAMAGRCPPTRDAILLPAWRKQRQPTVQRQTQKSDRKMRSNQHRKAAAREKSAVRHRGAMTENAPICLRPDMKPIAPDAICRYDATAELRCFDLPVAFRHAASVAEDRCAVLPA